MVIIKIREFTCIIIIIIFMPLGHLAIAEMEARLKPQGRKVCHFLPLVLFN